MTADDLLQSIAGALEGVRFKGESPYDGVIAESSYAGEPYRPRLFTRDWPYSSAQLAELLALPEDVPVEVEPFDALIAGQADVDEAACSEETLENVRRMDALWKLLRGHLYAPRAFRVGDGVTRLDCYVLGYHESGEIVGFKTSLLEK
jgi:hypothetical protein